MALVTIRYWLRRSWISVLASSSKTLWLLTSFLTPPTVAWTFGRSAELRHSTGLASLEFSFLKSFTWPWSWRIKKSLLSNRRQKEASSVKILGCLLNHCSFSLIYFVCLSICLYFYFVSWELLYIYSTRNKHNSYFWVKLLFRQKRL